MAHLSDVELASLSAAGGREAFGVLMARHAGLVRGLVRRMGAQAAVADDIAQDAFIAAYSGIGGYRGEGPALCQTRPPRGALRPDGRNA